MRFIVELSFWGERPEPADVADAVAAAIEAVGDHDGRPVRPLSDVRHVQVEPLIEGDGSPAAWAAWLAQLPKV